MIIWTNLVTYSKQWICPAFLTWAELILTLSTQELYYNMRCEAASVWILTKCCNLPNIFDCYLLYYLLCNMHVTDRITTRSALSAVHSAFLSRNYERPATTCSFRSMPTPSSATTYVSICYLIVLSFNWFFLTFFYLLQCVFMHLRISDYKLSLHILRCLVYLCHALLIIRTVPDFASSSGQKQTIFRSFCFGSRHIK